MEWRLALRLILSRLAWKQIHIQKQAGRGEVVQVDGLARVQAAQKAGRRAAGRCQGGTSQGVVGHDPLSMGSVGTTEQVGRRTQEW